MRSWASISIPLFRVPRNPKFSHSLPQFPWLGDLSAKLSAEEEQIALVKFLVFKPQFSHL